MGAAAHPIRDVGALVGPEESTFDAEAGWVEAEVTAGGVAVEGGKYVLAQSFGCIDEEGVALEAALMHETQAVVVQDESTGGGVLAGLSGQSG